MEQQQRKFLASFSWLIKYESDGTKTVEFFEATELCKWDMGML